MKKVNLDVCFQLLLFALFIILLWKSASYPLESRLYPQIIGMITSALLIATLARSFRKGNAQEKSTDPEVSLRRKRFLETTLIVILATGLGFIGGFILGVLCYYIAYAFLREEKGKRVHTLSIGMGLTVLFYIVFGWFMNVPLLRGWLADL